LAFGDWLKRAMDQAGITTDAELARRLGVSEPSVWRWTNNRSLPKLSRVPDLARVLSVSQIAVRVAMGRIDEVTDLQYDEWKELYFQTDPAIIREQMAYIRFKNQERTRAGNGGGEGAPASGRGRAPGH
jgi:transcriptional regulator with XRE-family HTH domain